MQNNTQIIHHLWWLRRFLDDHFGKKEYKDTIHEPLSEDIIKELNELLAYIKVNY